jgi:hypothetical protein
MQSFADQPNPPPYLGGLIIDNFAGGGAASTSIEIALGRSPQGEAIASAILLHCHQTREIAKTEFPSPSFERIR